MAGRRIRDIVEARACISEIARSGADQGRWCRARGIDGRSLQAWRMNLAARQRTDASTSGTRLVELVAAQPAAASRYVLRVGAVSIEVEGGFDEASLLRLLAIVSSC